MLLACIGLFGLMSYNVARRTGEIGVRLALGAQRRAVIGMVMSESIRLVAVGTALGLAAVLWAGRFVQTVVYGLSPSDPLTIGGAVALIAGVTALAGGVPARRASNVNPIEALRQQSVPVACGAWCGKPLFRTEFRADQSSQPCGRTARTVRSARHK